MPSQVTGGATHKPPQLKSCYGLPALPNFKITKYFKHTENREKVLDLGKRSMRESNRTSHPDLSNLDTMPNLLQTFLFFLRNKTLQM